MFKILTIFGTRPEAVKMFPVVDMLKNEPGIEAKVCITAQHRGMLDQLLSTFSIVPDYDLDIMRVGQDLTHITSAVLHGLVDVFEDFKPDRVLVQGDTATTFAAALQAFYHQVPVAHIEAGLRTGDIYSPWPEEMNRKLTTHLSDLHFAPTSLTATKLYQEGIHQDKVFVTGNTVIDTLFATVDMLQKQSQLKTECEEKFSFLSAGKRLILVTGHRRESFGEGFQSICKALAEIAQFEDVEIIYPVHLNPKVQEPVQNILGGKPNVFLVEPLDYVSFVYLMQKAKIILTDSGGIQEEAPSLGKPVLVMREVTERQEGIAAGTTKLVGVKKSRIVEATSSLLNDESMYQQMSQAKNPFGDGHAAERIVNILKEFHGI